MELTHIPKSNEANQLKLSETPRDNLLLWSQFFVCNGKDFPYGLGKYIEEEMNGKILQRVLRFMDGSDKIDNWNGTCAITAALFAGTINKGTNNLIQNLPEINLKKYRKGFHKANMSTNPDQLTPGYWFYKHNRLYNQEQNGLAGTKCITTVEMLLEQFNAIRQHGVYGMTVATLANFSDYDDPRSRNRNPGTHFLGYLGESDGFSLVGGDLEPYGIKHQYLAVLPTEELVNHMSRVLQDPRFTFNSRVMKFGYWPLRDKLKDRYFMFFP